MSATSTDTRAEGLRRGRNLEYLTKGELRLTLYSSTGFTLPPEVRGRI